MRSSGRNRFQGFEQSQEAVDDCTRNTMPMQSSRNASLENAEINPNSNYYKRSVMSTLQNFPAAQQTASANEFTFTHDGGTTEVVFFPKRPGPIGQGQPATGPELTYKGPEGSFTFFSDKIDIQNGSLGLLISVTLGAIEIFGGTEHFLRFSLILPPVNMGETKKQSFHTFGIKTATTTGGVSDGAQLKYTVVPLKGLAEIVILPA
jgi:hypothetical protein